MKKLFFAIVALAFVATSCSKDEAPEANQAVGATKTVTFAVNTPVMKTRLILPHDGLGFSIDKLYYAFYEKVGDTYVRVDGISSVSNTGVLTPISFSNYSSVELKPTLVVGKTYKAIFWAQSSKAPYTVSMPTALENAVVNMNYYDPSKLIYEESDYNTEKYDAFYQMIDVVVTEDYDGDNVLLYRPFAQLNLAVLSSDQTAGLQAGVYVKSVKLSVKGAHNAFNLATGKATGEQDVVFPWHAAGGAPSRITDGDVSYYNYSVHYILLGAAENSTPKELTNVTFEMSEIADSASDCDADPDKIVRSYESVPVQSNYRTYIAGDVITGGATYNYTVQIDLNFDNEEEPTIHPAQ